MVELQVVNRSLQNRYVYQERKITTKCLKSYYALNKYAANILVCCENQLASEYDDPAGLLVH